MRFLESKLGTIAYRSVGRIKNISNNTAEKLTWLNIIHVNIYPEIKIKVQTNEHSNTSQH